MHRSNNYTQEEVKPQSNCNRNDSTTAGFGSIQPLLRNAQPGVRPNDTAESLFRIH